LAFEKCQNESAHHKLNVMFVEDLKLGTAIKVPDGFSNRSILLFGYLN
jgi:hypothetical protein